MCGSCTVHLQWLVQFNSFAVPGFFVKPYNALQALQQFSGSTDSDPEFDYLVYFLVAMFQGLNPEIDGLEIVMLNKMENFAALTTHKSQNNFVWFHYKTTFPVESTGTGTTNNS